MLLYFKGRGGGGEGGGGGVYTISPVKFSAIVCE